MKKTFLLLIIMLCMVSVVFAYPYYPELDKKAEELKGINDYRTAQNINDYVYEVIEHKFYRSPRGISKTWKEKKGDCTDKAMIQYYMLRKNKIKSRLVHGLADGVLHDWIEVNINGKWETPEVKRFNKLRRLGYGIW